MVGIEGECGRIAIVAEKTVVVLMRLYPQPGVFVNEKLEFDRVRPPVVFLLE